MTAEPESHLSTPPGHQAKKEINALGADPKQQPADCDCNRISEEDHQRPTRYHLLARCFAYASAPAGLRELPKTLQCSPAENTLAEGGSVYPEGLWRSAVFCRGNEMSANPRRNDGIPPGPGISGPATNAGRIRSQPAGLRVRGQFLQPLRQIHFF